MINKISRWSIVLILLTFACQGDEQDDEQNGFEGILLRDDTNASLGTKGSRDLNDWGNDWKLSAQVLKLLATTPERDLSGTEYCIVEISGAYPNPASDLVKVDFRLDGGPSVIRVVLVNEDMRVLFKGSYLGAGINYIFTLTDVNKFPDNSIIRMYYSISKAGDENFYVGHGDILICREVDCLN